MLPFFSKVTVNQVILTGRLKQVVSFSKKKNIILVCKCLAVKPKFIAVRGDITG